MTRPSAVNASKEAQMMQSSSSIPRKIALHDQYTLMQRARACLGVEHLYVWFDHFLNHAQPWTAANSNPSRKRKVINLDNDVDDDEDEGGADRGGIENSSSYYGEFSDNEMIQMRCRFHIGLNDLLRSGVIALKNNGTAVAKQYFSWMTE